MPLVMQILVVWARILPKLLNQMISAQMNLPTWSLTR